MFKPCLVILAGAALVGCGTVIDFGPEPGTSGDEGHWHYQPELHGPDAVARAQQQSQAQPAAPAPAQAPSPPPATSELPTLPPPPPASATPPAPTSEAMFNDAIRRSVEAGDIDRALKLLEEAERLGSRSARPTFIESVGARGQ